MKYAVLIASISFFLTGCLSKAIQNTSGKNVDMNGFVMYGTVEMTDNVTYTPTGKIIVGDVSYKSRKVGIPADQKVPNTGSFRAVKTKSFFGSEEFIVEYDWTAGSDSDAAAAEKKCEDMKKKAEDAASGVKADSAKPP